MTCHWALAPAVPSECAASLASLSAYEACSNSGGFHIISTKSQVSDRSYVHAAAGMKDRLKEFEVTSVAINVVSKSELFLCLSFDLSLKLIRSETALQLDPRGFA